MINLVARLLRFWKHELVDSRPKLSYSQTGEDIILDFLLGGKRSGFYVDVGAYHPRYLSNTYLFYKKGWRGINIEPNFERFRIFERERKGDINLNIGIGEKAGEREFFVFDVDTLSTFSRETAENYKKLGHKIIKVRQVGVMPLAAVLDKYAAGKRIDFMSIDTEGCEMEILRTNDWKKHRPNFIVLETMEYNGDIFAKKLNSVLDPFMKDVGYTKVADTNINTIYKS